MFFYIYRLGILALLAISVGACSTLHVSEGSLSNGQRVAAIENTGNGFTPPATVVLLQNAQGDYQPIAGGIGAAVVPSALSGAVGSMALGGMQIAASRLASPSGPAIINNVDPVAVATSRSRSTGGKNVNINNVSPTLVNTTGVSVN